MITLEHATAPKGPINIYLTQQEALEVCSDLLRAMEEAKDHETMFPVTMTQDGRKFVQLIVLKD